MDDRIKMAFTFAADITKQLIALSTAVIGAIVTFGNGVLALKVSGAVAWALGCYGVSAIAGAVTGGAAVKAADAAKGAPDAA